MGVTAPSANQDLPSESGSGDSDVTTGNGSANTPIDNPNATTPNANPTDPDVSEQINPSVASTPIFDPSLPTPNSTPPTDSATTSSGKQAQAVEGQPLPPTKRRRQGLAPGFINTSVTSVDGATVVINKKPHKEQSDKGRKRAK